jgi:hypothetical protein
MEKKLLPAQQAELVAALQNRFEKKTHRHGNLKWVEIQAKLEENPTKLWSLFEMERTEGEPDVVDYRAETNEYVFFDCSKESPKGRRSLCYDREALDSRKEAKPAHNVWGMAQEMGVSLLDETQYRFLQTLGNFDTTTSSWIQTPADIRKLGGALFGDFRYGHTFVYHNGASSYYAARGFRACLVV